MKTTKAKRSYNKLHNDFILEHLMGYYESPKQSFRRYCAENGIIRERAQLQYSARKIGLHQLKKTIFHLLLL